MLKLIDAFHTHKLVILRSTEKEVRVFLGVGAFLAVRVLKMLKACVRYFLSNFYCFTIC